ncbi:MAG: SIS domain-containing protein [Clostridia bacterium]|nr:SIS domain-containing protein [Clostridia bacterium]
MSILDPKIREHLDMLINRYPSLSNVQNEIIAAYKLIQQSYSAGRKLLLCGNGGSASDSEHIVGELMKSFKLPRKLTDDFQKKLIEANCELGPILAKNLQGALPAIALDGHFALTTAYMNDVEPLLCFAQQVYGFGVEGDVLLGISTSGNSKNVLYAATVAKAKGMKVIGLTGAKDSKLSAMADICVKVPSEETYQIQELHLPVYHCWCLMLEAAFFGNV